MVISESEKEETTTSANITCKNELKTTHEEKKVDKVVEKTTTEVSAVEEDKKEDSKLEHSVKNVDEKDKKIGIPKSTKSDELKKSSEDKNDKKSDKELDSDLCTTAKLLSVLGDGEKSAKEAKDDASSKSIKSGESISAVVKPTIRYIYKLKSKSGKILKYSSNTPIILKRPIINLTKMTEDGTTIIEGETDEIDSDNSIKENIVNNKPSGDVSPKPVARKRGRPPLSAKPRVDKSLTEANVSKISSPFGMQTRKRQLKFLPDGTIVNPNKKVKSEDEENNAALSAADSDMDSQEEDEHVEIEKKSVPSPKSSKNASLEKKPEKKTINTKKVFDFETYYREKNASQNSQVKEKTQTTSAKPAETPKSKISQSISTPASASKKATPVDPAQLLSSLIGVPILPSQLNIVKFKPKVIQERNSSIVPKKVTIEPEKKANFTLQSDLLKNTPYKVVSKPSFQKILPKPPFGTPEGTTKRILATSTPTVNALIPKINKSEKTPPHTNDAISKFENFTDSKVVKTKAGPKKIRKLTDDNPPKTIYELLQFVFDEMPSWNLHVIPDTNSFCIAQVSRGRMGIPILKKSIELNGEFFAKVYVHQLHCKRYDGVYDTENKIMSLIKEIDALAA